MKADSRFYDYGDVQMENSSGATFYLQFLSEQNRYTGKKLTRNDFE